MMLQQKTTDVLRRLYIVTGTGQDRLSMKLAKQVQGINMGILLKKELFWINDWNMHATKLEVPIVMLEEV